MAQDVHDGINVTTSVPSVPDDDWPVLQPLWDLVLANQYYTASPLFLVFVANSFFFVCMIPYIFLDFYALDRWQWVKRYGVAFSFIKKFEKTQLVTREKTRPECG